MPRGMTDGVIAGAGGTEIIEAAPAEGKTARAGGMTGIETEGEIEIGIGTEGDTIRRLTAKERVEKR